MTKLQNLLVFHVFVKISRDLMDQNVENIPQGKISLSITVVRADKCSFCELGGSNQSNASKLAMKWLR